MSSNIGKLLEAVADGEYKVVVACLDFRTGLNGCIDIRGKSMIFAFVLLVYISHISVETFVTVADTTSDVRGGFVKRV